MKKLILLLLISTSIIGCGVTQNLQEKLIAEHPEWTQEEIALIKNNKIDIGMTKDMVTAAWGEPNYVNETNSTYTGNMLTLTYYALFGSNIKTVTFQDNKVTMFNVSEPN